MARMIDATWLKCNMNKVFPRECDQLYGMLQLIDEAPTLTLPNEWVSVEERLPEHLKDVIALYGNGRIDIDWVDSSGDFKFGSLFDGVTHWMPLPAPPDCRPPEGEKGT